MDAAKLDAAIKFSVASENPANKDLAIELATSFGREPFDTPIGPVKPRGALSGIIIRNGYVVAEWGETTRVDMTFSVTKSFLSTVVGLDVAEGVDSRRHRSRSKDYMPPGDSPRRSSRARITRRSRGSICCGRQATGRERSGASPTGRIVQRVRRPPIGRIAS